VASMHRPAYNYPHWLRHHSFVIVVYLWSVGYLKLWSVHGMMISTIILCAFNSRKNIYVVVVWKVGYLAYAVDEMLWK